MIISNIKIYNLYGEYNYNIKFDSKINFLYGSNGCGKTTVLNILASVVTGKLYNLVDYRFETISLEYLNGKSISKEIRINIEAEEKNKKKMLVIFEEQEYEINDIYNLKERIFRKAEDDNIEKSFFSMYPFGEQIKNTFNYVYLPLSRYGNDVYAEERDYYRFVSRKRFFSVQNNPYNTYLNDSLQYVEDLIRNSCAIINAQENKVNDKFRKDVLSSSIVVSDSLHILKMMEEVECCKWEDVLKSKEAYIKTLEEIGVYDKFLQEKIELFFKQFERAYDEYQEKKKNQMKDIRIDLVWQYSEFSKIKGIAELAKKNEEIKENIRRPKELFLEVIDDFFMSSGTDKKVVISREGEIYFESHSKKLRLTDLSSGEKQIIITFASLIFGLKGKTTGIFIVDEPEASLHLEWQAKFVSAIMKINENIQFIFATHSPELIGKYRNKAIKLIR